MNVRTFLPARYLIAALAAGAIAQSAAGNPPANPIFAANCAACDEGQYNTAIVWNEDIFAAAKQAREQEKLLFVLQLSGNFKNETFT